MIYVISLREKRIVHSLGHHPRLGSVLKFAFVSSGNKQISIMEVALDYAVETMTDITSTTHVPGLSHRHV